MTWKLFKFSSLAVLGLLLAGCGPVYTTTYHYKPPKSWRGKQCVNRCLQNRSQCYMYCNSTVLQCRADANRAARPAYRAYVRYQRRHGLPINRNLSSFANYSQCTDRCGCENTYRQCYTNCGGQVKTSTICTAFCKKAPVKKS